MELGRKLRQARLEAGLSQRQLCGEMITRNMLSAIENGSARPSMETLRYLARELNKPISFFFEEEGEVSLNGRKMEQARQAWDQGNWQGVLQALEGFREPDPVCGREKSLLLHLSLLKAAEEAIREQREPYARELLDRAAAQQGAYVLPELKRRELLLRSRFCQEDPAFLEAELPSLDEELLLRARAAAGREDYPRAAALLESAQDHSSPAWALLRGELYLREKAWQMAAECFLLAQKQYPAQSVRALEVCYRELGDFRRAYHYACIRRCE